ncbi:MAG: hypothetical protein IJG80_05240 [Selenomonadaceae bacterium]|nr:hypothetical protein [Selenomonadaceae bacterium]MBQ3726710.1 hypothetical protein [Selenomonadaceae bacterium]MBQ9496340.1 hypothetical protein [Selenomonadaceae bacterium]
MFDKNPEEHYLKEGDPAKPTYYIIRRMNETTDISTMYRLVMGHVRYALSKGWLPVVDMQNYPNPYLLPEKLGQENAWEYYFEQPFRVDLAKAYDGENVVLSDGDCVKPYPDYSLNLLQKKNDDLVEWRMLVKLGLMKVKPELSKEIVALRDEIFVPGELTLGVLLRGSESDKKIKGQPIPPPAAFAVNSVSEKFKEWECDKIILATSDQSLVEMFRNNFGDRCVPLDQICSVCYDTAQDDSEEKPSDEMVNANRLQGKKDLMQAIILRYCNFFISERCSDATITMFLVKKFGHALFFNFGNY